MATKHCNGNGRSDRAVLYLRMSSAKQDASIDQQRDQLVSYAKQHGYTVIREYADQAISGDDTARRTAFLQMREDAGRGEFSIVLCWDQDRFGRFDPIEGGFWILPFRDAGVRLETISQGKIDWTDFAGRLLYVVQQEAKHAFLRDLSRNVSRGALAAAQNGKRSGTGGGGNGLFGYVTHQDGRVEVVEDQAQIVRRIFALYLQPGSSLRAVANVLNSEGVETLQGGKWTQGAVRRVLTQRKYTGCYCRFRHQRGTYHAITADGIVPRSKQDVAVEGTPLIVIPGNHTPIIDDATFEAAQVKLSERQVRTAPRTARQYILSGLVVCADCGKVMTGHHSRDGIGYTCSLYHAGGRSACYQNRALEVRLLPGIVRLILARYCGDEAIAQLRQAIRAELAAERKQQTKPVDRRRLAKRIEDLDQQISRGAERLLSVPETLVQTITAKLTALQQQRDQLQAELDAAGGQTQQPETLTEETVEAAISELETLSEALSTVADPIILQETLRSLIVRISLEFEHRPNGKRTRNTLTGGSILVRPDQVLSTLLFRSSRSSTPP